jgi:hypothetical protein
MSKSSNKSYAKVILDSVGPNGKRLISVEMRYWRAIHAEFMTHRDRARNAASSRAIPFLRFKDEKPVPNCSYSYVKDDAFFPEFVGTEQKGMQSGGELQEPNRTDFLQLVEQGRDYMLELCKKMFETGAHKSLINRYLEPWSYITVITTATEWNNFFRLRVHPKAEKHFEKVARQCKVAIERSEPVQLRAGEWHMPYLRTEDSYDLDKIHTFDQMEMVKNWDNKKEPSLALAIFKRISAARCARLSYLTHEGIRDLRDDIRLFESLIHPKFEADRDDDVIHSSPLEHVGMACDGPMRSGPFDGWLQFRKEFPNENVPG